MVPLGESLVEEAGNLLRVERLQRGSERYIIDSLEVFTLLPVATELVGPRPAYEGYLPLWCFVSFAAVYIRGPT